MGTRADFYVWPDDGPAEWLGSIAWDGHPGNPQIMAVCSAVDEAD